MQITAAIAIVRTTEGAAIDAAGCQRKAILRPHVLPEGQAALRRSVGTDRLGIEERRS